MRADALLPSQKAASVPESARSSRTPNPVGLAPSAREKVARRILVPTDFSPASVHAVDCAVALANQCRAALTILHVIDVNTQSSSGTAEEVMTRMWNEGFARMGQLAGSLAGQVDAQTILEEGLPWESIVAKSRDYDVVVLGQDGRKRGWGLFSKHTVERVLEESACPVLVVRDESAH
jgi:nucleotide-binding universal stress UspA family protein